MRTVEVTQEDIDKAWRSYERIRSIVDPTKGTWGKYAVPDYHSVMCMAVEHALKRATDEEWNASQSEIYRRDCIFADEQYGRIDRIGTWEIEGLQDVLSRSIQYASKPPEPMTFLLPGWIQRVKKHA